MSGCSLKSVQAAATLLVWADEANLSARTDTAIEDAYTQWYDNLSDSEQEGFAEAWPMIKEDAAAPSCRRQRESIKTNKKAGRLSAFVREASGLCFIGIRLS